MCIAVCHAVGLADTALGAFDNTLAKVSLASYNLVRMSSGIPLGASVVEISGRACGTRSTRVAALHRLLRGSERRTGDVLGAGLAWYQFDDGSGLFVEEHQTRQAATVPEVEDAMSSILPTDMHALLQSREVPFEPDRYRSRILAVPTKKRPASALVIAAYSVMPFVGPEQGIPSWILIWEGRSQNHERIEADPRQSHQTFVARKIHWRG